MKNNKFEKKVSKIEFLKLLMMDIKSSRCNFCKYHWQNYKYPDSDMQHLAMNHFANKCKTCINNRDFLRLKEEEKKAKYWYEDNFKPLYDWEESNKGVNNE